MIIIVAVVVGVCRAYTRQAKLHRAVVVSNAPATTTVVPTTTQNNTYQAPPAFNPSAAYGGYATPAGNMAPPSYPATGYLTTGYPTAGYPTAGYSSTGYPTTGYPPTGYPSNTGAPPPYPQLS